MVSLVNFKFVNEESNREDSRLFVIGQPAASVRHDQQLKMQDQSEATNEPAKQHVHHSNQQTGKQPNPSRQLSIGLPSERKMKQLRHFEAQQAEEATSGFVVSWRNLRFVLEPKWHERAAAKLNHILSSRSNGNQAKTIKTESASSQLHSNLQTQLTICDNPLDVAKLKAANVGQFQSDASSNQPQPEARSKLVLDRLDGSFKSGELTAILGPSGAGKTTLLDCLTGRRKSGLSGSIRIHSTSSASSVAQQRLMQSICDGRSNDSLTTQQRQKCTSTSGSTAGGAKDNTNLKVSIIPQNDHLISHLTVYETLNYASKMKNCFDPKFNHKLNIRRVAQQLGLMSCLNTRINKLSGGQYKRVSIAQELLSSPDILILDEPTSGLDAMTCLNTVQVLRRLTSSSASNYQSACEDEELDVADERNSLHANKQIAVILTIHQPNSDVFQQFNHVYVVAQGGRCIYEGPPSCIEPTLNRIGITLPNSYYNPATLVVEVAAGKFGLDAIQKLNVSQRKQYLDCAESDEQRSIGDSAVDCPSLSASSGDEDENNDEHDDDSDSFDTNEAERSSSGIPSRDSLKVDVRKIQGLVNNGFVFDEKASKGGAVSVSVIRNQSALRNDYKEVDDDMNSVERMKIANHEGNSGEGMNRRKPRRRPRKRDRSGIPTSNHHKLASGELRHSTRDSLEVGRSGSSRSGGSSGASSETGASGRAGGTGSGSSSGSSDACSSYRTSGSTGQLRREKRLKLNSLKAGQKFPFWRHTFIHFHRCWLSIIRDPMLCSMQLALHVIVPVMVSLVYGSHVGQPNACPRAGPVDIMAYALEPTDSALQLQEELRTTLENIGYIFFKLYGIIFAAMTVTVLTFPLDMHVLVKEYRNGWYGLSSYFIGRTLADIPFQLTLPLLAMALSYYSTGQPHSYFQWRFLSITGILILSSLIAQSQGLLFGAILMDKMKAAVFVAPAATTPIILFAGFLVRTQSIPAYLRPLSNLSYLRYAIEACLISRYGFNQCECDPSVFNQTIPELPPIARSMLDYWLSSFKPISSADSSSTDDNVTVALANSTSLLASASESIVTTTTTTTTTIAPTQDPGQKPDLFTKLIDSLAKANSFGRNITSCEQVVPYPMIDYDLRDSQLIHCFAVLLFMLLSTRVLTFFIVRFKVKRKV